MEYIIGIDQSTQGTKLALVDAYGNVAAKLMKPHRQIISKEGWISHDMEEVYGNILSGIREVLSQSRIHPKNLVALALCNQRETTVMWDRSGKPAGYAVVWQCDRAKSVIRGPAFDDAGKEEIADITGLPLSPYFPAAKMKWLLQERADKGSRERFLGTVDSYLVYRMTEGKVYATDPGNASRTQLMDVRKGCWDKRLCEIFGISFENLPEIIDSDGIFGETDLGGILPRKIPIHAVMGDSHAALYGQGCLREGMLKVTYGTGASMMLNTGDRLIFRKGALASSVAFRVRGRTFYALEGNINYAGSVISWLKDKLGLIADPAEVNEICRRAVRSDQTVFIPAFSGLSAPYWKNDVRACLTGMDRNTGREEIVKAAVESIANQVADIAEVMEDTFGKPIREIRADGGPTGNPYLMEYQAGITGRPVLVSGVEELSLLGAVMAAGNAMGFFEENGSETLRYAVYHPEMQPSERSRKRENWKRAVGSLVEDRHEEGGHR